MLDAMKDFICETEQRTSKNAIVLIESEFATKFDLLAEGQGAILDKALSLAIDLATYLLLPI